jgi:rfaE bifunctional protein nucleotidyltransferase chain/domain
MNKFELVTQKIIEPDDLGVLMAFLRFKNQKVVFTNGCFDLIHRGHIEYLAHAASLGNFLIIGLNTDESVKRIKGHGRPVQDEYSRALQLASFQFVNRVVMFNEDTPLQLIEKVIPDILVKGGDYVADEIVGADVVRLNGGEVVTIDFIEGFSTTHMIEQIKKLP